MNKRKFSLLAFAAFLAAGCARSGCPPCIFYPESFEEMISILQRVHDGSYPHEFIVPNAQWTEAPVFDQSVFFNGCTHLPPPPIEEIEPLETGLASASYLCSFEADGYSVQTRILSSFLPVGSVRKLLPLDVSSCRISMNKEDEMSKDYQASILKEAEGCSTYGAFRFAVRVSRLDRQLFLGETAMEMAVQYASKCLEDAIIIA